MHNAESETRIKQAYAVKETRMCNHSFLVKKILWFDLKKKIWQNGTKDAFTLSHGLLNTRSDILPK